MRWTDRPIATLTSAAMYRAKRLFSGVTSPHSGDDNDVCRDILRQRGIVEGIYGIPEVTDVDIRRVLAALTRALGMQPLAEPLVFSPDEISHLHHGIAGFQPWAESGCSLYTWREPRLFTLDIYSCKGYALVECVDIVVKELQALRTVWRDV